MPRLRGIGIPMPGPAHSFCAPELPVDFLRTDFLFSRRETEGGEEWALLRA